MVEKIQFGILILGGLAFGITGLTLWIRTSPDNEWEQEFERQMRAEYENRPMVDYTDRD